MNVGQGHSVGAHPKNMSSKQTGTEPTSPKQASSRQRTPAHGQVWVLSGPNLGRLGMRDPAIYGSTTYAELVQLCQERARSQGWQADVRQTDDEASMIGWIHAAADAGVPVVLNPGAWTHYSYALRDACAMLSAPLIEVHLSQIAAREAFRHNDVIAPVATATITGLGVHSYLLGIDAVAALGQS